MNACLSGGQERSLEALWAEQRLSATSHFFRVRPRIVIPAAAVAGAILLSAGIGGVQLAALWLTCALLGAISLREASRARVRTLSARSWLGCLLPTVGAMLALCAFSGAIESPFLPLLLVPTVVTFALFGPSKISSCAILVAGLGLAVLYGLALSPAPLAIPLFQRAVLTGVSALCALLLLKVEVTGLVEAGRATAQQLDDIRRQTLADAELRSRTLDTIGARVAHEIKNPLTAISGLAQLLAREESSPRARRRLNVMLGEIGRVEGILQDYLTFSRPLSEVQPTLVDARRLADEVVLLLEGTARDLGVELRCIGPAVRARLDPRLVKQALLNLVKNALEATPSGRRVAVIVKEFEHGVQLEVHDDGRGMDAETLAGLGRAFFTGRDAGTGLGVALVRTIARQHEGELDFVSEPGLGTTARLTLRSRAGAA